MVIVSKHSRKALLLLSSLFAVSLSAQTAAETQTTTDSKTAQFNGEDVIKLSPFEISTDKDTGYKASNSIGGTRSNTPIKDIALNIQVFNKDLADDLMTGDQTALERYNAALINGGADVNSENNIQQAYNSFLFRGFVQNWGLRDGVREYDPVDIQGLARVEIVKGPAAALYGVTYAGGVMNNITKTVDMHRNFTNVRFTGYNEGGYRATIDANFVGKAADGKIGIRFNGANAVTQDKREHSAGNVNFTQTNIEYQPLPGTQLKFLVEQGTRQKPNNLGYYTYTPGTADIASNAALKNPGDASIPLQVAHPQIPWTWNWANPANVRQLQNSLYRFTIDQAIGDNLHLNAYIQSSARNQSDDDGWDSGGNSQDGAGWDVNGSLGTGWVRNSNGTEFIRMAYHSRSWNNRDHAIGATAVYKFDIAAVKNTITAGGANWDERFFSRNGNQPNGTPDSQLFILPVAVGINTTNNIAPSNYVGNQDAGREHSQNKYTFISWQLSALDNRLKLNAGLNHTTIKDISWPLTDPDGTVHQTDHTPPTNISKSSPMIGGMFDITKEISIFAVHATSLFPTTDKNDFNVQMPPVVGKSNEFGVKTELLNGKISGTISYYKTVQNGGSQRDINAINQNKVLWDSMTAGQRAVAFPGVSNDAAGRATLKDRSGSLGDLVPGTEATSKGVEADLVIQPIKTLQIMFSASNGKEEVTSALDPTVLGTTNTGFIKQQYSIVTKYTFDEGAAKGLSLGLGFQAAGKALQGYDQLFVKDANGVTQNDSSGRPIKLGAPIKLYNPSTKYLEFFASYKFKAFGLNHVVQFNAKNLTKQDDFIGWKPSGNYNIASTERYTVPTYARFSLTWGLDF